MKIDFYEPAYKEYEEAKEFYNMQNEVLGDKFVIEVDKTIKIIRNYPESFPKYTNHTRKAVVNVFPYNIIYTIYEDYIEVLAIAHQHRKPDYWIDR
jgi:hypothetical protein